MEKEILEKALAWVQNSSIDTESRQEIDKLIQENKEDELVSRFYKTLEFGTAGMRGKLGAGLNRFNVPLVRQASQGLANYIHSQTNKDTPPSIAIAHDNRLFSDVFTREAACVFAGNGIKTYLFPSLHTTPVLSFAVRTLRTTAGVVITASHNPPEYNGYKVYWSDGAQITHPHDEGIMQCIQTINDHSRIKQMPYQEALGKEWIDIIFETLDQKYYSLVEQICIGNPEKNRDLGLVYTPLHGTGIVPVREIFRRRHFDQFSTVKEQEEPDGHFPTVSSPNPENPSALALAQQTAASTDSLILATDPDSDRIGAMVRHQGAWIALNGNQIGELLLNYYLNTMQKMNQLPKDGYVVSTIVTSELVRKMTESYGLIYHETLTGFKNIAQIIREQEIKQNGTFFFGMEEAHGYMFSDFVRDKDGISASVIFAEMAAELKHQGKTPLDYLDEIHQIYGFHEDSQINHVLEGQAGAQQIQKIMEQLRKAPPQSIGNHDVKILKDYQTNKVINSQNGKVIGKMGLGNSNVLAFDMEDGSRITARPSGTEPKIKFYFNLCGSSKTALIEARQHYEQSFMEIIHQL
ncbi:MAG: phospho-sugar mutase [SAR324 cluster bacterium]|nr:phospho-sugar mutase [SAR324 cluster bacterium]